MYAVVLNGVLDRCGRVKPFGLQQTTARGSDTLTCEVIEAGGGVLAVAEGWHRGPTAQPVRDAEQVDLIIERPMSASRPNVALNGKDFATPWEPWPSSAAQQSCDGRAPTQTPIPSARSHGSADQSRPSSPRC
ncbi:hypothetical protein [Variovorax sp. E3]|uniref:hypothetical protein n=1 Tax=Variovorax sp. E3 TaxID=1914993 RepID=UPI0018DB526F|nr:hypothetical protein [Variovorax sp. E3]